MGLPGLRIDTDRIIMAIAESGGNVTEAAAKIGCTRQALWKRAQKNKAIMAAVVEAREVEIDYAETALHRRARKGEPWAVMFTLRTIGRSRGYVEKTETEITGQQTVVKIYVPDNGRNDTD